MKFVVAGMERGALLGALVVVVGVAAGCPGTGPVADAVDTLLARARGLEQAAVLIESHGARRDPKLQAKLAKGVGAGGAFDGRWQG